MSSYHWTVDPSSSGMTLQKFIKSKIDQDISLKKIKHALDKKGCFINGKPEKIASRAVQTSDRVEFRMQEKEACLEVLFEDDDLIVFNKPSGIVCSKEAFPKYFLVHRLDKETTGCLLAAKNEPMQQALEDLFRTRKIKKTYIALCQNIPKDKSGTKETLIDVAYRTQGQTIYQSASHGKSACTHWKVLQSGNGASLIECEPVTGRTHQIRVHLKELGVPILGDYQYNKSPMKAYKPARVLLHAKTLSFIHPKTAVHLQWEATIPDDFKQAMEHFFK